MRMIEAQVRRDAKRMAPNAAVLVKDKRGFIVFDSHKEYQEWIAKGAKPL